MPIIVVPDDEPSVIKGTEQEQRLRELGELRLYDTRALSDEELLARVADADIVYNIRSTSVFTRNVMEHCSRLKLIAIYGVGYDNVDVQAASELGITVCNTPGYSAAAVAEMSLALMLAVSRRVVQNDRTIRAGGWARGYSTQLYGKTLGIIGAGNIGQRMIQLGKAIGMETIAWTFRPSPERSAEYNVEFVSLEELMLRSDVISIHVLGVSETSKLISKRELALMKPNAILINTSRGAVVDELALIDALQNNKIAGAGLDVFVKEPLPEKHPLRSIEIVVLSPHTSSMTPETTLGGLAMTVDNVDSFLRGRPVNVVNNPAT